MISGFILMLSFARQHLFHENTVSLKKFYWRRLTRLELPYLLVMIFLFFMKIIVQHENFARLLPHLGATLLYAHMPIFHEISKITPITWSLEIEVQFYLLVPFLAGVFRLSKPMRRGLLLGIMVAGPLAAEALHLPRYTILTTFQYFLAGFLLADLYLCADTVRFSPGAARVIGGLLLTCLLTLKPEVSRDGFFYSFVILAFYIVVFNAASWKKVFRNPVLTSIGGMCYSIYLLHFAIIAFVGTKTFFWQISDSYIANLSFQLVIHSGAILVISAVYYLLIEKPCMDPAWPQKLWRRLVGLTAPQEPGGGPRA